MKKMVSQIWLGIICVILGFMITYQFKASSSTQIRSSSRQYEDMAKELESLKKQKDDLTARVKEYQDKVNEYEKAAADDSIYVKKMKEEIDNLRNLAGLEDESGKGIVITIKPRMDMNQSVFSPVRQSILLDIVNELNSTGVAEAIAINDERYTGRTQIREVGNIIKINDARFDPNQEFEIKAIGDPDLLYGAFLMPGNILYTISDEYDVKWNKQDNIKIPMYSKSLEYKYIK